MELAILLSLGEAMRILDLISEPTGVLILAVLLLGLAFTVRRLLHQNEKDAPIHRTLPE